MRGEIRRWPGITAAVVVCAFVLGGCALTQVNEAGTAWTNDQRAGTFDLVADATLESCAQRWADELATLDILVHDSDLLSCLPPGATAAGENLAAGTSVGAALEAILNSPAHATNMRDTRWTRFAVASAYRPDGAIVMVWRFSN